MSKSGVFRAVYLEWVLYLKQESNYILFDLNVYSFDGCMFHISLLSKSFLVGIFWRFLLKACVNWHNLIAIQLFNA